MGPDAAWRTSPLTHYQVLERILQNGAAVNPILEAPWVECGICRADWLHVADQGIAADLLGNFLVVIQTQFPGRSLAERVRGVSQRLQTWYHDHGIADRFDVLLPSMFMGSKNGYKLRGSAAKIRAMIPFAWTLAQELLADADPVENTVKQCACQLWDIYQSLSEESILHADVSRVASTKFALLYVALNERFHEVNDKMWRLKPKLHLFLHICSDSSQPSRHWNYRDEDYGGMVSRLAKRRGGLLSPCALSRQVLNRFAILQPMVRILG